MAVTTAVSTAPAANNFATSTAGATASSISDLVPPPAPFTQTTAANTPAGSQLSVPVLMDMLAKLTQALTALQAQPSASAGGGLAAAATGATPIAAPSANAAALVDPKYRMGPAPAAGSLIDTMLSSSTTTAMPARTDDSSWVPLTDPNGASIYANIHGALRNLTNDQLRTAIQQGTAMVHVHPDNGTIHIHDM